MLIYEEHMKNDKVCYFDSSNVLTIKYSESKKVMAIIYGSGREYLYEKVPKNMFLRIRNADSQGKIINNLIKKSGMGKKLYNENLVNQLDSEKLNILKEHIKNINETINKQ